MPGIKISLSLLLLFSTFYCVGQLPTMNPYVTENDQLTHVAVFDIRQPGTYYYDPDWNIGHIHLKTGDSLVGYYIRFDLVRNHLEVLLGKRKVGIYGTNIDRFSWFSPKRQKIESFISKTHFTFQGNTEVAAFLEVLTEGPVNLLKSKAVISRYQSTSPSLVQDEYASDINTLSDYFLVKDDMVFEVSGRKRALAFLDSEKLESYVKENGLNFRIEEELIQIVRYYNQSCIQ